jgi:hypothetical protein
MGRLDLDTSARVEKERRQREYEERVCRKRAAARMARHRAS